MTFQIYLIFLSRLNFYTIKDSSRKIIEQIQKSENYLKRNNLRSFGRAWELRGPVPTGKVASQSSSMKEERKWCLDRESTDRDGALGRHWEDRGSQSVPSL